MAKAQLPPQLQLRQLLEYKPESGLLFWNFREPSVFNSSDAATRKKVANAWNKAHAGREAFTSVDDYGYRRGSIGSNLVRAHIVIWVMCRGFLPPYDIDHINGDRSDNRIANLRLATRKQNNGNQKIRRGGSSRFKGVCWHGQANKWTAGIGIDGRRKHLGLYSDETAAALAYDTAARDQWGAYARTNFQDKD